MTTLTRCKTVKYTLNGEVMQLNEFLESVIKRCNRTDELLDCYMGPCNRQKLANPIALVDKDGQITHIASGDMGTMISVKEIVDMSFD